MTYTPPRYDEVFWAGQEWLNSLDVKGTVTMADEAAQDQGTPTPDDEVTHADRLASVAKNYNKSLQPDLTPTGEEVEVEPDEPEPAEGEEAAAEPAQEAAKEEPETPTEEEAPTEDTPPVEEPEAEEPVLETLIVDGKEVQVPIEDVYEAGKRARQMDLAAERRLDEAKLVLKQAREEASRLKETPPTTLPATGQPAPADPNPITARIQAIEEKLFLQGVEDETEFRTLQQEKASLQDQWYEAKQSTQRQFEEERRLVEAAKGEQDALVTAVTAEHEDWAELTRVKDPATGDWAIGENRQYERPEAFNRWLQSKPDMYANGWMTSTDPATVNAILSEYKASIAPPSAVADMSEKRLRKTTIDPVEGGSGRVPPPKEKKPESGSEYVARLAKERHSRAYSED